MFEREEVKEERNYEIAKNLLKSNVSTDMISSSTGLSVKTIQNLKSNPS